MFKYGSRVVHRTDPIRDGKIFQTEVKIKTEVDIENLLKWSKFHRLLIYSVLMFGYVENVDL